MSRTIAIVAAISVQLSILGAIAVLIAAINIAGGVVLVVLGLLMVSGLWTRLMSSLQGVMANVQLPL